MGRISIGKAPALGISFNPSSWYFEESTDECGTVVMLQNIKWDKIGSSRLYWRWVVVPDPDDVYRPNVSDPDRFWLKRWW